jgi:hypothetical protein
VERSTLTTPAGYLLLIASMAALYAGVVAVDRAGRSAATALDLDEPALFPTQRFDLAR